MDLEAIFSVCNVSVLPGWLLLVFAPRWTWTQRITTGVTAGALSVVYLTLIVTSFGKGGGGFSSLAGVAQLFSNPAALLAGWVHYLVFDLFTGSWEARDAMRLKIPHWMVVPCLFLTLMFGPIGLLSYLVLRLALRKQVDVV